MGGYRRMGPRMAPLYRRAWRRPLWGWYPIYGPYVWGVGCLLPVIGAAALFVLALLRAIF
jgi:hypothetical protein